MVVNSMDHHWLFNMQEITEEKDLNQVKKEDQVLKEMTYVITAKREVTGKIY